MMDSYKKIQWYQGETLVQSRYEQKWYTCREKNFTIRGGEIDLIMENEWELVVVEVKVVNYVDNLHDYITAKKLFTLRNAIDTYLRKYPSQKKVRVDIVFVKNEEIVEVFENIEL